MVICVCARGGSSLAVRSNGKNYTCPEGIKKLGYPELFYKNV